MEKQSFVTLSAAVRRAGRAHCAAISAKFGSSAFFPPAFYPWQWLMKNE
jgi:hypothetical protein